MSLHHHCAITVPSGEVLVHAGIAAVVPSLHHHCTITVYHHCVPSRCHQGVRVPSQYRHSTVNAPSLYHHCTRVCCAHARQQLNPSPPGTIPEPSLHHHCTIPERWVIPHKLMPSLHHHYAIAASRVGGVVFLLMMVPTITIPSLYLSARCVQYTINAPSPRLILYHYCIRYRPCGVPSSARTASVQTKATRGPSEVGIGRNRRFDGPLMPLRAFRQPCAHCIITSCVVVLPVVQYLELHRCASRNCSNQM